MRGEPIVKFYGVAYEVEVLETGQGIFERTRIIDTAGSRNRAKLARKLIYNNKIVFICFFPSPRVLGFVFARSILAGGERLGKMEKMLYVLIVLCDE